MTHECLSLLELCTAVSDSDWLFPQPSVFALCSLGVGWVGWRRHVLSWKITCESLWKYVCVYVIDLWHEPNPLHL